MSRRPALSLSLLVLAAPAAAQTAADAVPATIDACYVPASGTIYRIDTPASPAAGAPKACLSASHVKFTWNQQGPAGPAGPKGDKGDPGGAASIGPDLTLPGALAMGKTGTFGGGLLATNGTPLALPSGGGTRFMWIPQKGAIRAGSVNGAEWDDENVGSGSTAFGSRTVASGVSTTAVGALATASGSYAIALGTEVTASGAYSVALGNRASTNGMQGAFVLNDASSAWLSAEVPNQFLMRASGGVKLRTSSDLQKGCNIDGAGNLACTGTVTGTNTGAPAIGPDLALTGALSMGKTGTFGGGLLAADATPLAVPDGPGVRFMWIPQKSALRAGRVNADHWAERNVGEGSVAIGDNVAASGVSAVALGAEAGASGANGVAIGLGAIADGARSIALGTNAGANGHAGAIVISDGSSNPIRATQPNQVVVRGSGGIQLLTNATGTQRCDVQDGRLGCSAGLDVARTVVRLTDQWRAAAKGTRVKQHFACPAGTVIIGGGVETDDYDEGGDVPAGVTASYPRYDDNAWITTLNTASGRGVNFRLYVVCLRGA